MFRFRRPRTRSAVLTPRLLPPTAVRQSGRVFRVPRPGLLRDRSVAPDRAHRVYHGAHPAQPDAHSSHRLGAQKLHRPGQCLVDWAGSGAAYCLGKLPTLPAEGY